MCHADDPGQQPGRAHVGAGQPDSREEESDLGALRRDTDVARRRDHGPRAGHRSVERRHDRAAALADGENEVAGETGELEQSRGIPREQRADDVLDISAGAEGPAGAGDDDGANARLGIERAEGVPELGVDLEGERVEPLGPVEGDGRDGGRRVDGVEERLRIQGHRTAVASISTSACGSTSDFTSTSAIAGKCVPIRRRYTSPRWLEAGAVLRHVGDIDREPADVPRLAAGLAQHGEHVAQRPVELGHEVGGRHLARAIARGLPRDEERPAPAGPASRCSIPGARRALQG